MIFEKVSFEVWEKSVLDHTHSRTENFWKQLKFFDRGDLLEIWQKMKLPQRATKFSAGYDFFAPIDLKIQPGEIITIPTGIKWNPKVHVDRHIDQDKLCWVDGDGNKINETAIPYFLSIYPRSSLGRDYSLREPNIVSIIDADYYGNQSNEGHIMINIKNEGTNGICVIEAGTAYAQGIIQKYYIEDNDVSTGIRMGGFGSTSK